MRENSHWYCILCKKTFFPYLVLQDNEFKEIVIEKLSMILATLFPCFTLTLTRYHLILMNCKASYQSQKITLT